MISVNCPKLQYIVYISKRQNYPVIVICPITKQKTLFIVYIYIRKFTTFCFDKIFVPILYFCNLRKLCKCKKKPVSFRILWGSGLRKSPPPPYVLCSAEIYHLMLVKLRISDRKCLIFCYFSEAPPPLFKISGSAPDIPKLKPPLYIFTALLKKMI